MAWDMCTHSLNPGDPTGCGMWYLRHSGHRICSSLRAAWWQKPQGHPLITSSAPLLLKVSRYCSSSESSLSFCIFSCLGRVRIGLVGPSQLKANRPSLVMTAIPSLSASSELMDASEDSGSPKRMP